MESLAYLLRLRTVVSNLFIALFGYLLPALNSAKAVINSDMEGIQEMLYYWSVFSIFVLTESVFDTFLDKLPFYYEVKAIFILYLTMLSTQGAYKLYHKIVKPYFEKYENHIDDGINKVTNDAQAVAIKNVQGLVWHFLMKSDRLVIDFFTQIIYYILNFDPGTSKKKDIVENGGEKDTSNGFVYKNANENDSPKSSPTDNDGIENESIGESNE